MVSQFYKTDDRLWNSGWFPTLLCGSAKFILSMLKAGNLVEYKQLLNKWAASSKKVPSNMCKMQRFKSSCAFAKFRGALLSIHMFCSIQQLC